MHRRTKKNGRLLWAVMALASLGVADAAVAEPLAPTEYQVKAVFIYNFSRFVEWPADAFTAPNEPFVIGVLGSDPFGSRLDEAVRGELIGRHPLVVRRFRDVTQIGDCRILFIDRSEEAQLRQILASLSHHSVLTVSDLDDASERGIMIELATQDSRVRLRVNVASARAAGLTISANLLRLAQIVRTADAD